MGEEGPRREEGCKASSRVTGIFPPLPHSSGPFPMHSLNKYFLSTYYVPTSDLGTGDIEVNKQTWSMPSWGLPSGWKGQLE